MSPKSVLVTGANRGIGLGLLHSLLKNTSIKNVIATCRNPDSASELANIKDERFHIVKMDVTCDDSIQRAYKTVETIVGDNGLNLLVNNAGIYTKYTLDGQPKREDALQILNVNAVSVLVVSQVFLPLLRKAASVDKTGEYSIDRAAIVTISSGMGSIGDNTSGSGPQECLIYRASKSAVNSICKTLSLDLAKDKILVVAFCPGWVKTDMGGPRAAITVDESADALITSFSNLKEPHNGGYFRRDLVTIPF